MGAVGHLPSESLVWRSRLRHFPIGSQHRSPATVRAPHNKGEVVTEEHRDLQEVLAGITNRRLTRRNVLKYAAVGGAFVVAGPFATACGSSGGSSGDIKIGALYPISGDLAALGTDCVNGFKLGVDEINAAGGIKSMGGAKIEVVAADSQGKPDVALSEVQRLNQQDHVSLIVGTYQSAVALPVAAACERASLPFLVTMAVADAVTSQGFKETFRICSTADYYAKNSVDVAVAMGQLAPTYRPVKRVALLHEDTDFGQSTSVGQIKYLKEDGLTLCANVAYPASSADLTTQVQKVKASNPDMVLTTTYLNDSVLITQAREKLGMKGTLFLDCSGGTVDPQFVKKLGPAANGILTEFAFSKFGGPAAKTVNDKFRAKYSSDMTENSGTGYQGAYVLTKALELAGSSERSKLRDALAAVELDAAKGDMIVMPVQKIKFGADGQQEYPALFSCQIQNGVPLPFWPKGFEATKIQITKQ